MGKEGPGDCEQNFGGNVDMKGTWMQYQVERRNWLPPGGKALRSLILSGHKPGCILLMSWCLGEGRMWVVKLDIWWRKSTGGLASPNDYNKVQEERNDFKTELLIRKEAGLKNLEMSQPIHTREYEKASSEEMQTGGQRPLVRSLVWAKQDFISHPSRKTASMN